MESYLLDIAVAWDYEAVILPGLPPQSSQNLTKLPDTGQNKAAEAE
jgi:hypothetical protein